MPVSAVLVLGRRERAEKPIERAQAAPRHAGRLPPTQRPRPPPEAPRLLELLLPL
jgi:hypothetical protein